VLVPSGQCRLAGHTEEQHRECEAAC
jgi:hypothetical protein